MPNPLNQDAEVRRIDADLRARFPHLTTRIFEVEAHRFLITFPSDLQDSAAIAEVFDHTIRQVTVAVTVGNALPSSPLRELGSLSDAQAAGTIAGLAFTTSDLLNILVSRHPDSGLVDLKTDPALRKVTLFLAGPGDAMLASTRSVLEEIGLDWDVETEISASPVLPPSGRDRDPMFIWASALRPAAPEYVRRDEAFWFDNLSGVADGRLPVSRFPGMKSGVFRCYLDLTAGGAHINLRQAVLLYDEVWCSLPLAGAFDGFLARQGLARADLLAMVEVGRLRFVTTQPEERLDVSFLRDVDACSPYAILGRRTTAALLVSDVARTAQLSRLAGPEAQSAVPIIAEELALLLGGSAEDHLSGLLWPFQARRGGLQGLMDRGSKARPALGLARAMAAQIKAVAEIDVELELLLFSEQVHLGHALDATVFPGLDTPAGHLGLMSSIGEDLNFHRNFNTALAAAWVGNERRRAEGVSIMPDLPLFEFDPTVPIEEILADTALGSTRASGRALMARLADLHPQARDAEAVRLEVEFRRVGRKREGRMITFDSLDTAVSLASLFLGFVYPPLAGLKTEGLAIAEQLRRVPAIDRLMAAIETDSLALTGGNRDLDFLSRISRVARFRRSHV